MGLVRLQFGIPQIVYVYLRRTNQHFYIIWISRISLRYSSLIVCPKSCIDSLGSLFLFPYLTSAICISFFKCPIVFNSFFFKSHIFSLYRYWHSICVALSFSLSACSCKVLKITPSCFNVSKRWKNLVRWKCTYLILVGLWLALIIIGLFLGITLALRI